MAYQAEYIWIDGTEPVPLMRSKTRIYEDGKEPGIWGFDGSSTNQASGDNSDVVLQPVFTCPDPIRGGDNVLVMCETQLTADFSPHPTNTRAVARAALEARLLEQYTRDDRLASVTVTSVDGADPGDTTIHLSAELRTGTRLETDVPFGS